MSLDANLACFADLIKDPFEKYVVSPVVRHVSYPFRSDSKVETLQHQVEKLNNKRLRLQQSVDDAARNGEEIFPDVTKWLTTAAQEIEEAETLIHGKAEAMMNKCFFGIFPNLKTRYLLSKKAHEKALAVCKQLQDAQSDRISFRPPMHQIVEPSVYTSEALPSRVLILNQIMDALRDPKLNMLGVYGMGGVGKTRLAKEVRGKAIQEKKLFDAVVMVAVSQNQDLRRIQGEIADSLGLKFDAEEIPGRACQLQKRLERAKLLIILDDVWQKLDLNAVGVPYGGEYEGCKILITSRRKEVLCNEMLTQKEFSLDVLKREETWRLFEICLSNIANPELHQLATEIAKKCAGLPLLILKVAADLRGKESYAWSDMLNRLSSVGNTEIYEKVHKVIESSYENLLDEEAKSVFLLCALFGDSNIAIHSLLMYCAGLGLFMRIDSIEGVRNRVLTLIDKLKDECLLLDGDSAGFVKIHDVVRDIAIVIASRSQHAFVGSGKVRPVDFQNKHCARISLPYCDICELPGVLECPEAEVFSLFANGDHLDIPNSFLKRVPKLKVVDFTGVCFVSGLPMSLGFLAGLQTLCLQRCELNNVAIIAELKQMEVLCFVGSSIEELPREIKGLTRLKLLDLRDCHKLKLIPANVFSNLSLLEELYLFNSFSGWGAEGNASLVELKNLSHLTTLEIHVKDDKFLPEDWFFNGMQNYRISIGDCYNYGIKYETSRRIIMLELKTSTGLMHRIKELVRSAEVIELGDVKGVENLLYDFGMENLNSLEMTSCSQLGIGSFGKLRILRISKCDTLKSLFSYSFAKYLPQLQELELRSCGSIEAIAGECRDEVIEFTHLNSMKLRALPNLTGFGKTSRMVSFPSLTSLVIYDCKSLKYVFTNSMVKSLKQLKELEIRGCELMEEIILSEEIEENNINKILFPELVNLQLENLQNLKRFCRGHPVNFPSLRVLEIYKCRAIENLVSKFFNGSDFIESVDEYLFNEMVTFSNLEELSIDGMDKLRYIWIEDIDLKNLQSIRVSNCLDLKYVFPASVACGLPKLRMLRIYYCSVEVIIGKAKDETFGWPNLSHLEVLHCYKCNKFGSSNSKVTFSNLEKLSIKGMNNLRYILNEDINIEALSLKNLQAIEVSKCVDMKYVFPASVACGLLQLQKLEIKECGVDVLIENSKDETVGWPNLTSLVIHECKSLKYTFTDSMAKSLKRLKTLQISNCKLMEEVILSTEIEEGRINRIVFPELVNLRLKNLEKLKRFSNGYQIEFLSVRVLEINKCRAIENLVSKFFNRSNINEGDGEYLFNEMVTFSNLEELYIDGVDKLRYIWRVDIDIKALNLKNVRSVRVSSCPDLKYVFPASAACGLPQLQMVRLYDCGVEVIIAGAKDETFEWPKLTHFVLLDCHNLIKFGSNNSKLFPNVEVLELDHHSLKAIQNDGFPVDFSLNLKEVTLSLGVERNICDMLFCFLRRVNSLERLSFTRCYLKLGGLFSSDDEREVGEHLYHLTLKHLEFIYVSDLKHILKKDSRLNPILQHLHSLEILSCDDLMNIAPSAASFRNLTTLRVDHCGKMTSLVTASTAKTMVQLMELRVSHCNLMEEIVANDDSACSVEHDAIIFKRLKQLELICLDRLSSFCSCNSKFSFPLLDLEQVTVRSCPRMKIFCCGILSTPKLHRVEFDHL